MAGSAVPAGRHVGRRGHELLALLRARRPGRAVPVRRGGQRGAHRRGRAHRPQLALLSAGHRSRPALRLPRLRPLRPRGRPALQPGQAADRPVRQGDRGPRRLGRGQRAALHARRHARRRPRARRRGLRAGDPQVGRRRPLVRLGRRRPAAAPVERDDHLRDPRQGLHQAPSRRARGPARHLRRPGLRGGPGLHPAPGRHRGRAAADPPHRRRVLPARSRAQQLLGLQLDRLPGAATPSTPPPAASATRCASSRGWSRRCTAPASR